MKESHYQCIKGDEALCVQKGKFFFRYSKQYLYLRSRVVLQQLSTIKKFEYKLIEPELDIMNTKDSKVLNLQEKDMPCKF